MSVVKLARPQERVSSGDLSVDGSRGPGDGSLEYDPFFFGAGMADVIVEHPLGRIDLRAPFTPRESRHPTLTKRPRQKGRGRFALWAAYRPASTETILVEIRIRLTESLSCVFLSTIHWEWKS